jgi:dTDP-glucose 4,6-dehydratase
LYVDDHCRAIRAVLDKGCAGQVYNIGGSRALPNIEVVQRILAATGHDETLIKYVADRPGHDRRYAITSEKVERETGWKPQVEFEAGLAETVRWYKENAAWIANVRSGAYRDFYEKNYGAR